MKTQKFYDADLRPPRGGWSVVIAGNEFSGGSEADVHEAVKRWRKNNGTFVSDLDIEREIWAVWIEREPGRQLNEMPGIFEMAKNLAGAGIRVLKAAATGNPVVADTSEFERKAAICRSCVNLDSTQGEGRERCRVCACFLSFKLSLATEHCPIGRF